MDIKAILLDIIQDYIDFPASEIDTSAPFKAVAALDSFMYIEMISALEEKFGINIPNADLRTFKTIDDIIAYVEKRVS